MADLGEEPMVDEVVQVPLGAPTLGVRVIALRKSRDPGEFEYLQGMKSGLLRRVNENLEKTEVAIHYHRNEAAYFAALADVVSCSFDAIVSPPSDRAQLIEPYRHAIMVAHRGAVDLTDALSRPGTARAGEGASDDDFDREPLLQAMRPREGFPALGDRR